jgi:hypothetical protein
VAENQKMLEELGLNTLASEIITSLPQPAQKKGKNQQTRELITKIHHHRSISLMKMIKEIILMMKTLNLMSSHNLRCFFYLHSSEWGILGTYNLFTTLYSLLIYNLGLNVSTLKYALGLKFHCN